MRLIGYTENTIFANAVRTAWRFIPDDKKDYRLFFWAAARVCDDDPDSLLEPIFDYWESLSDEKDEDNSTKKSNFAAYGLKWKFREYVPHRSISFMLQEAEKRDSLNFYILYMLSEVDHADVLEAQAMRLANSRRRGTYMPSAMLDGLRRNSENGKILSIESKQRLLSISENLNNDDFLRESAFEIWEMSPNYDDSVILQQITKNDIRFEVALMGRAKRKDITAIDRIIEKINESPLYWWQATRYLWHKDFEKLLEEKVANIDASSDLEIFWMIGELFEKIKAQNAESLLIKYWNNLSNHSIFIQIALMVATPNLQELVAEKLKDKSDVEEYFIYFSITLGLMTRGRKGIHCYEQMKAIEPYFEHLDESSLSSFSEICLKQGWDDISQVLEPLIKEKRFRRFIEIDISRLTESLERDSGFVYWWISDRKKEGWSHQNTIEALFNWFEQHNSEKALNVISKPLSENGKRLDYRVLEGILQEYG